MMRSRLRLPVVLIGIVALLVVACGGPDQQPAADPPPDEPANEVEEEAPDGADAPSDEPVTISAVTYVPEDHILSLGLAELRSELEAIGSSVSIDVLGGPEVIPSEDQHEAVRTGAVDMALVAPGFIADTVPETLGFPRSELTIEEEVEAGAIAYVNEFMNERLNAWLLGRASTGDFTWFLRDPIESADDFEGLLLRGTPGYAPLIENLGAEFVSMAAGEIYTALERGVVDGFPFSRLGTVGLSLHEQICCIIEPGWWHIDMLMIVNLDVWNSLSETQQGELEEAMRRAQARLPEINAELEVEEQLAFDEAGVVRIDLGPEFATRMTDASWDWLHEQHGDEMDVARLEELFRR